MKKKENEHEDEEDDLKKVKTYGLNSSSSYQYIGMNDSKIGQKSEPHVKSCHPFFWSNPIFGTKVNKS